MTVAAFLFDLDGTLIDSERPWVEAMIAWLADYGRPVTVAELAPLVSGRSWRDIHTTFHGRFPELPQTTLEEDARALHRYYDRIVSDPAALAIPAAWAFLHAAARLAPCAVVSGSPGADVAKMVEVCGGANDVRFVLGCESCTQGKPSPEGYLKAAARLDVDPRACVVVEDSPSGVKAGLAAGMRVIGVRGNSLVPPDFTGCTWVVDSLAALRPEDLVADLKDKE